MAETVSIRLALTGAQDVTRGIKQVGDAGDKELGRIDVAAGGLGKTIGSLASTVVPVLAAAFSADKFVEINREISKLQGSLVGITGSTQGAAQAMSYLEGLTSGTTLTLQGVTEAFIRLKTLGLDASQQSLMAYGNIAAAMGKDIMQFIEAVADATTGEFERLKEFGITASKQGDKIRFTFQGITTEVANSATEIGNYLRKLGENQFGDAMANQAKTLNGAFIDAGNAVVVLAKELGESGLGQAIATITRLFADATRQIADFIDSFESIGKRSSISGVRRSLEENVAQQKALADQMQAMERSRASGVAPTLLPAVAAEDARRLSQLQSEQRQLMRRLDELQMPPDSPRLTTPTPVAAGGGAGGSKAKGGGGGKNDAERLADAYERQSEALKQQIALFGDTSEAAKVRYETEHGELAKLAPAQKEDLINRAGQLDALKAQQEAVEVAAKAAKKAQEDAQREEERRMESLTRIVEDGAGQMADAFVEFALTGKTSFGDMISSILRDLVKLYIQAQIIKPLMDGLTGGDAGGFLGAAGRALGLLPALSTGAGVLAFGGPDLSGLHFSARGDAFAGGNVIPFARGGIVTRPTLFAMANGAGLMGEAGPEAVMPLARDSAGRLGVRAGGGVVVNVHNYAGAQVRTEQRQNADGGLSLDVIVERVEAAMATRVGRGGGLAPTLERQYGLNRTAGAFR